jgi:Lar family restriction alleviation protein
MEKLKPCPFCGGKAAIYGTYRKGEAAIYPRFGTLGIYDVRCQECNAGFGDTYTTEELVIEKWNRRVKDE